MQPTTSPLQGAAASFRPAPAVLVVEDDRPVRSLYSAYLRRAGFHVDAAPTVSDGRSLLGRGDYVTVVSDLWLPDGSALDLLADLRRDDSDVPLLVLTGAPSVESAIGAIEQGVHRYLCKPVSEARFVHEVYAAATKFGDARTQRQLLVEVTGREGEATIRARKQLDEALETMWLAAQPIVSVSRKEIIAYELLLRTNSTSLPGPLQVIAAAERQSRTLELGRRIRAAAADVLALVPEPIRVFVNLQPDDVFDPQLSAEDDPLVPFAHRVTFELTERSRLDDAPGVGPTLDRLRARGYQIALDDLGCGYSGLSSFALLRPNIVKLDRSLVQGVDSDRMRASVIRAVLELSREVQIEVVAEGVETTAERDCLVALGCDLLQGYLFARPERGLPSVAAGQFAAGVGGAR